MRPKSEWQWDEPHDRFQRPRGSRHVGPSDPMALCSPINVDPDGMPLACTEPWCHAQGTPTSYMPKAALLRSPWTMSESALRSPKPLSEHSVCQPILGTNSRLLWRYPSFSHSPHRVPGQVVEVIVELAAHVDVKSRSNMCKGVTALRVFETIHLLGLICPAVRKRAERMLQNWCLSLL